MFKAMKDAKRRAVEQVLYTVGASEKTVDQEYDDHVVHFEQCMGDMNECGAGLTSVLTNQKLFFSEASELAAALARMYIRTGEIATPGLEGQLEYRDIALEYRDIMLELNTVIRTSAAMVATEQALQPLYAAVTALGPEIEEACKQRNSSVLDYDSHRRRVKTLEQKKEGLDQSGKAGTPAYTEVLNEIARFQSKLQASQDHYHDMNAKTKKDIQSAKVAHDRLLESLLITTITSQAELFTASAKKLESLLSRFPQNKVQQVKTRINDYVKQGGVSVPKEEKSTLVKGLALVTGKATLSELKAEEERSHQDQFQASLLKEKAILAIENEQKAKESKSAGSTPVTSPANSVNMTRGVKPAATTPFGAKARTTSPLPPANAPPPPPSFAPPPPPSDSSNPFGEESPVSKYNLKPAGSPPRSNASSNSPPRAAGSSAPSWLKDPNTQIKSGTASIRPPPPSNPPGRAPSMAAPQAKPSLGRVIALYNHVVDADDELEFSTGDIIEVLEKNDDGWWKGKCKGKEGLFPVNYVKPV